MQLSFIDTPRFLDELDVHLFGHDKEKFLFFVRSLVKMFQKNETNLPLDYASVYQCYTCF